MVASTPVTHRTLILALGALALASPAAAGETACWFENGVVVVPAEVAGIVGDWVLDTGTAHSQLNETKAQMAGFTEAAVPAGAEVRLAGERLAAPALAVADLDLRTGALPTPIGGVLGADLLKDYVVDVRFAPCRVSLHRQDAAPTFGRASVLPLAWADGVPVVEARATDGPHILEGAFAPATGSDTAVRLADDAAQVRGAAKPQELYPYGVGRPVLRALELDGRLYENLPGGLLKAAETPALGEIGTPLLAQFRLRFDFPGGRLLLAKEKGPPAVADGP